VGRVKARCRKTARLTAIYGSLSTLDTRHRENRSMAGIDIESGHQATLSAMRLPWGTQIECGWFVIVAACGWGPPPVWHAPTPWKPATSLDEY
jgi:hypothetical protein